MASLETLFADETLSREQALDATRRWRARYKIIPQELKSPDVVGYLNSLTQAGFKNFDVTSNGNKAEDDYKYYNFSVEGRGYYSSLYQFVWDIENNRNFYRVNDLTLDQIDLVEEDNKTGKKSLQIMVSFRMNLNAYFGGAEGVSAPDADQIAENGGLPIVWPDGTDLPPVPKDVLPDERPAVNPFYPNILSQLPPNTDGLVELGEDDGAELVSIVGGKAVFRDGNGYHTLGVGDAIYLGQIVDIDPIEGRVAARLNKGGIIDRVEKFLGGEEGYRQAMGRTLLSPSNN
jgi:hypothetical protein